MYTIKRLGKHVPMATDPSGKKDANYITRAEPYEPMKTKPKSTKKKQGPFRTAKRFEPTKGTFLGTDDGCLNRFHYEKQGYYDMPTYKEKGFSKDKKAVACLRGAPFGSKNAPRRDEFHRHIQQLQWKELLNKEKKYMNEELQKSKESDKKLASDTTKSTTKNLSAAALSKGAGKKAYDRVKGGKEVTGFDNSWKMNTQDWIVKKGYGIKKADKGTFCTSADGYGNFDLNAIERPKFSRVNVTREFYDISHLG